MGNGADAMKSPQSMYKYEVCHHLRYYDKLSIVLEYDTIYTIGRNKMDGTRVRTISEGSHNQATHHYRCSIAFIYFISTDSYRDRQTLCEAFDS